MYEIHITCYTSQGDQAALVASALHWKTSEIARDPVLGNDTYYYLTTHTKTLEDAVERMNEAIHKLQFKHNVVVVREKIEHIVHDIRHRPK